MVSDDSLPLHEAITKGVKTLMISGVFEKGKVVQSCTLLNDACKLISV